MKSIDIRLTRLERENQYLKFAVISLGCVLALFVFTGARKPDKKLTILDEVRAKAFTLIDKSDQSFGQMTIIEGFPTLFLSKAGEDNGVKIVATESGGHIHIASSPAKGLALSSVSEGDVGLALKSGAVSASLAINKNSTIILNGKEGSR